MPLKLHRPLVTLDIETTGLSITKDRIVEIALIKLMPSGEEILKRRLVNPNCSIPKESTEIHGITDEMVKDAPTFREVANEISQFIAGCDLSGYNCIRFDLPLLNEEFLRVGIEHFDIRKFTIIDVQRIFHKMEPRDLPSAYKLYCGKTMKDHHNPEADVRATLAVLKAQVDKYETIGDNPSSIEKYLGEFQSLDSMNRLIEVDDVAVFNFGKHKGKPVAVVLKEEPQYYDWIMKSDFSLHTKKVLSEIYAAFMLNK